ncbi:hypothetical protein, partial [Romboutsia sp.]|uniref:hypothetical protein n=1 Tax=Romboutsia sp. TaxID=1965302 RepID=UPI002CC20754|nr:hypothetical protein [Romboutsia sp.]
MGKVVFVDVHITGENKYLDMMEKMVIDAGHEFYREKCKTKAEVLEKTKDADAIVTTYTPIDKEVLENS